MSGGETLPLRPYGGLAPLRNLKIGIYYLILLILFRNFYTYPSQYVVSASFRGFARSSF